MQFLYDLPAARRQTQAKHCQRFVRATVARLGPHTRVRPVRLYALLCSADDVPLNDVPRAGSRAQVGTPALLLDPSPPSPLPATIPTCPTLLAHRITVITPAFGAGDLGSIPSGPIHPHLGGRDRRQLGSAAPFDLVGPAAQPRPRVPQTAPSDAARSKPAPATEPAPDRSPPPRPPHSRPHPV